MAKANVDTASSRPLMRSAPKPISDAAVAAARVARSIDTR